MFICQNLKKYQECKIVKLRPGPLAPGAACRSKLQKNKTQTNLAFIQGLPRLGRKIHLFTFYKHTGGVAPPLYSLCYWLFQKCSTFRTISKVLVYYKITFRANIFNFGFSMLCFYYCLLLWHIWYFNFLYPISCR